MFGPDYETTVAEFRVAKNTAHRLADQFERAMFVSPGIAAGYVVSTHEYINTWYTAHLSSITDQWED